jgi:hypothetical protein
MSTILEKALLQLGCIKSTDTNVGIATTTFKVINPNNLGDYALTGVTTSVTYSSAEAEKEYTNSVEWRKPDGSVSMTSSDFVLDYGVVGPVVELMMLREERNKKLAATDWVVTKAFETGGGVPESWKTYRQALRDITISTQSIFSVTWPTEPS